MGSISVPNRNRRRRTSWQAAYEWIATESLSCKVQSDYPLEQGDTTTVDEMEAVKILGAKFEGTSPPMTHTYLISS